MEMSSEPYENPCLCFSGSEQNPCFLPLRPSPATTPCHRGRATSSAGRLGISKLLQICPPPTFIVPLCPFQHHRQVNRPQQAMAHQAIRSAKLHDVQTAEELAFATNNFFLPQTAPQFHSSDNYPILPPGVMFPPQYYDSTGHSFAPEAAVAQILDRNLRSVSSKIHICRIGLFY